jgi:hypothetical protein
MFEQNANWVLGVAGADRYPTDGVGGADVDAADSSLVAATRVELLGIDITTGAAVNVSIISHDGTSAAAIPGMTWDATTARQIRFPAPVTWRNPTAGATVLTNVGIRCGAAAVAVLYYRKIA